MSFDIAFNPPRFDEEYDGMKMRQLVDELDRLHAVLTADTDDEGVEAVVTSFNTRVGEVLPLAGDYDLIGLSDTDLSSQGQYDLLFNSTGTVWHDTAGDIIFNPTAQYLQLANDFSINWLDDGAATVELLKFTGIGGAGGGGDPDFASVVLLCNFDGADAATTYTEESSNFAVASFESAAELDTSEKKFGTASALFAGTDDAITFPAISAYDLGSGDFTIELWIRFDISPAVDGWMSQFEETGNNRSWYFGYSGGDMKFAYSTTGADTIQLSRSTGFSADQWYHLAVSRNGSSLRIFIDGVQQGATFSISDTIIASTDVLRIGTLNSGVDFGTNGRIDEARMTVGVGRYTANFTPPTEAFSSEGEDAEQFVVGDPVFDTIIDGLTVDIPGPLTALSYGGILEANLLSRIVNETLTGSWTFDQANLTLVAAANGTIDLNIHEDGVGGVGATLRYDGGTNIFHIMTGNNPSTNSRLTIARDSGAVNIVGALTAATYGGITEANLLDKSASEEVTGEWDFTTPIEITGEIPVPEAALGVVFGGRISTTTAWDNRVPALVTVHNTGGPFGLNAGDLLLIPRTSITGKIAFATGSPAPVVRMLIDDAGLDVVGAITGDSYGGILEANLLDKTAIETVSGAYTFSGAINFTAAGAGVKIVTSSPRVQFEETGVTADNGKWRLIANAEAFALDVLTDAGAAATVFSVARTGQTVDSFFINAPLSISGSLTSDILRLTDETDASQGSTGHAFQIGPTSGFNMIMDGNEIMARDNSGTSALNLNVEGGIVTIGVSGTSNLSVSGAITAVSYSGVLAANLLDKTAAESISGSYSFNSTVFFNNAGGGPRLDNDVFLRSVDNPATINVNLIGLNTANTIQVGHNTNFLTRVMGDLDVVGAAFRVASEDTDPILLDHSNIIAGHAGLWLHEATPSTTNYSILSQGSNVFVNGEAGLFLRIANQNIVEIHDGSLISTGYHIGIGGGLATGRLTTSAASKLDSIHGFFDDDALEISKGSTSTHKTGIVLAARTSDVATGEGINFQVRGAEVAHMNSSRFTVAPSVELNKESAGGTRNSTLNLVSANVQQSWENTAAATDAKVWNWIVSGNTMSLRLLNDSYGSSNTMMQFTRSTTAPVLMELETDLTLNDQTLTIDRLAGNVAMFMDCTTSFTGAELSLPALRWRENDGTNVGAIRTKVDTSDVKHLVLGTEWLTERLTLGSDGNHVMTGNLNISGTITMGHGSEIRDNGSGAAQLFFDDAADTTKWQVGVSGAGNDNFIIFDTDNTTRFEIDDTSGDVNIYNALTLGDTLQMADNRIARPEIIDYGITNQGELTVTSSAATMNLTSGNVAVLNLQDSAGTLVLTVSNPPASGTYGELLLKVIQGSTARLITWPSSFDWPASAAPTLSTANDAVDIITAWTIDGGTTWYATFAQLFG